MMILLLSSTIGISIALCLWFMESAWYEIQVERRLFAELDKEFLIPDSKRSWITRFEVRQRKRKNIFSQFPDFLELFAMALKAGTPFLEAWRLATNSLAAGCLKRELEISAAQLDRGHPPEKVLRELGSRLEDDRLTPTVALIRRALQGGGALEDTLFEQATHFRNTRLLKLEKQARTASIKLLFPILVFIFPTLFILLFGGLILHLRFNGGI